MIKYHWTGEYRVPKKSKDDYFIGPGNRLEKALSNNYKSEYFILRREELPDTDGGE